MRSLRRIRRAECAWAHPVDDRSDCVCVAVSRIGALERTAGQAASRIAGRDRGPRVPGDHGLVDRAGVDWPRRPCSSIWISGCRSFGISLPWLAVALIYIFVGTVLPLPGCAAANGKRADSSALEGTGPGGRAHDFRPVCGRHLEAGVVRHLAGHGALLSGRGVDLLDLDGDTDAS